MPDIASLGLEVNTSQIIDGKVALDQFAEASARVDQKVGALNGQMNDTAKIMKSTADAAKAADDANVKFMATLEREIAVFGMGRGELEKYKAAELGLGSAAQAKAMALGMSIDAMHREEAEARALAAAQDSATRSADQFIKKLQDQVATLGMSAQQLQAYRAAQLGVSDAAAPLIAKLGEAGQGAHGASKHLDTLNFATVGARRELLVLAHELSQGNYSKFGGSMMVLGEQTGAAGLLFSATGLAALAFAGALAAVGYAMIKGASDQKHMNDALVMTGNYAGMTSDQLNNLAHAAVEAGGSLGEAKKVATELAGSGKFTGEQIGYITEATIAWEHATGMSVKSIIKDFESLAVQATGTGARATEAISRAVLKLDDQYHFLTEAVYEQIRALEKEGDAKGASALATEEFAKATHDRAEEILGNLGSIARGWNAIKEAIGQVGDAVGAFGARATPASEVAKQSTRLRMFDEGVAGSNQRLGRPADAMSADLAAARNRIVLELTAAVSKLNEVDAAAIAQGQASRTQSAGVHAASMLAASDARHLKDAKLELALASNKEYEAAVRAANPASPLITEQAIEERRLQAIKENTPKTQKAKVDQVESTELADRLARIQDLVNAEKQMYDTMGKMDDMFHAAGKLGDEEYYRNKKSYVEAEAKDQIGAYSKQIAEIQKYHDATEAEAAKHAKQISDLVAKRAIAEAKAQDDVNLIDAKEALRKDAIASASEDMTNKYLSGLDQEAKKLGESNAAHETSKGAIERETIARLDLAIAYQKQFIADQAAAGATAEEIAQAPATLKYLEDVRAARARIAEGLDEQQANQFKDKMADQAIKDWQRAGQSISESLTSAFGAGGKALGGMFQAYAKGMEGQLRAQKQLKEAKDLAADNPGKIDAINRAQLAGTQAQIQSYAGMTSAAQGFFSEGSRGYQAMHAATVALQGAEIALSLIKGVNAVLTQGEGDPYTAFGRMAAMVAIVAGLGVAISAGGAGGGGKSAADVQKAQGTGSVFGDGDAKSDSVRRSIETLASNSNDMLPINQGMLSALRAIESAMTGLTNLVVRTQGLTDGTNMGVQTGMLSGGSTVTNLVASIGEKVFGSNNVLGTLSRTLSNLYSNTKQTIVDSGMQYGGSVRGLQQGQGFDQYASVDTTKSSFFGLSKKATNSVKTAGLNDELSNQFGLIFTGLDKALQAASVALGGSAADVTKVLDNLTLESTKVSLKGLTGTALTDALNSVISKSMDEIAQAAFPQFDSFRKVGEGYAETVLRLAGDYAKLDSILAASSSTFGATGIASIAAREHLIELTGGIDELSSQSNSFVDNFLSKAEQLAPVQKYVTDQLAAMGLQSLDTRDKFKDYVLGLASSGKLTTEAGAQQYASLLALSEAFAKTHAATVDLTKSEQEIADERTDLRNKLDELTLTQAQLAEKARAAIDGHNLALYDQVIVAQAAKDKIAETSAILDMQGQTYAANGDKAGAAAVLVQQHANALTGLSSSVAAATKTMWEAQAAAEQKKRLDGLSLELLNAQGKSQEALNAQRREELVALSATEQAIKQATYAAIDKAKTSSLQMELLGAQGNDAEVKRLQHLSELTTLSAGDQVIKKAIYAAQNKAAADQQAAQVAQAMAQAQQQAAEESKRAAEALKAAWQGVTDSIIDEVKRIRGLIDGGGAQSMASAQAAFAIATGQARSGDQDAAKLLPGLSKAMLDLAEANAVTSFDLRLARAQAAASLSQTSGILSSKFGLAVPSYDVGTDYVPATGLALIHEGEKITPAAYNNPYTPATPGGSNADLVAEVRALRAEVVLLREANSRENVQLAKNTGATKDVLENSANGINPLTTVAA